MAHLDEARRAGYVEPLLTQIATATYRRARENAEEERLARFRRMGPGVNTHPLATQ